MKMKMPSHMGQLFDTAFLLCLLITGISCIDQPITPFPEVVTGPTIEVTANSAILTGRVNPNGIATSYYFEYWTVLGNVSRLASRDAGTGAVAITVSDTLKNLVDDTKYYYRIVTMCASGIVMGSDEWFTTTFLFSFPSTVGSSWTYAYTLKHEYYPAIDPWIDYDSVGSSGVHRWQITSLDSTSDSMVVHVMSSRIDTVRHKKMWMYQWTVDSTYVTVSSVVFTFTFTQTEIRTDCPEINPVMSVPANELRRIDRRARRDTMVVIDPLGYSSFATSIYKDHIGLKEFRWSYFSGIMSRRTNYDENLKLLELIPR